MPTVEADPCAIVAVSSGAGKFKLTHYLISTFLALISPVTALLPIFGLPFNIAALWFNREYPGGHRTLSRITFVVAVLISAAVVLLLLTEVR